MLARTDKSRTARVRQTREDGDNGPEQGQAAIAPPPLDGRYIVRDKRPRTTAEALLEGLRAQGFSLRVDEDGKLLVSPVSRLSLLQREALRRSREGIIATLRWETVEPTATTETVQAWFRTLEQLPPSPQWYVSPTPPDPGTMAALSGKAANRRIVLLALDGSTERVLAEPPAVAVHDEIRRLAAENPGRTVAAEWLSGKGWVRWLTMEGKQ